MSFIKVKEERNNLKHLIRKIINQIIEHLYVSLHIVIINHIVIKAILKKFYWEMLMK